MKELFKLFISKASSKICLEDYFRILDGLLTLDNLGGVLHLHLATEFLFAAHSDIVVNRSLEFSDLPLKQWEIFFDALKTGDGFVI